ncbi:MAG: hypothetical protein K2L38_00150 [Dysosmobacter sp.]|nr:hypothetical protein [Dysosmobacter sp.]
MSDRMRKALHDGGKIEITIEYNYTKGILYRVHESAFRLDSFGNGEISKEALTAAEDPDALIQAEISEMVREKHIAWEARQE